MTFLLVLVIAIVLAAIFVGSPGLDRTGTRARVVRREPLRTLPARRRVVRETVREVPAASVVTERVVERRTY